MSFELQLQWRGWVKHIYIFFCCLLPKSGEKAVILEIKNIISHIGIVLYIGIDINIEVGIDNSIDIDVIELVILALT